MWNFINPRRREAFLQRCRLTEDPETLTKLIWPAYADYRSRTAIEGMEFMDAAEHWAYKRWSEGRRYPLLRWLHGQADWEDIEASEDAQSLENVKTSECLKISDYFCSGNLSSARNFKTA